MQDSSQKPYLVRALHEWMADNGKTPHLVVDAEQAGVGVPAEFIKDGRIVLNCSYAATRELVIGNNDISFEARFNGAPIRIDIPMAAVLGIYARESGEGLLFADQDGEGDTLSINAPAENSNTSSDDSDSPKKSGPDKDRPNLRIVK